MKRPKCVKMKNEESSNKKKNFLSKMKVEDKNILFYEKQLRILI